MDYTLTPVDLVRQRALPAGRLHLNGFGFESNQLAQVVLVPGGRQPLVGDAHIEGLILPQQIVGDAPEGGHIVGSRARVDAAVVLVKGHIQDPVVGVFDGPVTAHRLQLPPGLGRETGNEATGVGRDPLAAAAFRFDPDQAGQVAPLAVGVACRPATADFDVPVVLPDRVHVVVGVAGEVPGSFQGEHILQAVVETLVVGPHTQHVVSLLLPDLAPNRLLTAHGVEGHDAAFQAQHAQ